MSTKEQPLTKQITLPIRKFLEWDAAGGFLLIASTIIAMVLANSPLAGAYEDFWQTPITFTIGDEGFSKPLLLWVNDGLMAIFFFLVGLEIKRQLIAGELSTLRKASLPFFAAIGGIILPVSLFFIFNTSGVGKDAWGVPMATDIAFAIGILSLLGSRVPIGLVVFLTAFAIVDDIGAILVIVLFYANEVNWSPLFVAGGLTVLLFVFNAVLKITRNWVYMLTGVFIWYYIFKSGIHPTVAGVLVAFCIPAKNKVSESRLVEAVQEFYNRFKGIRSKEDQDQRFYEEEELEEFYRLKYNLKDVLPPLQRLEFRLEEFVSYFVVPVFALANAGISLNSGIETISHPFTLSIIGALVIGKLVGIFGFTWLSVKLGLADLPRNTKWVHILGVSFLGGIGFTMAIFISNLAVSDPQVLNQAKVGILAASLAAGLTGYFLLKYTLPKNPVKKKEIDTAPGPDF